MESETIDQIERGAREKQEREERKALLEEKMAVDIAVPLRRETDRPSGSIEKQK